MGLEKLHPFDAGKWGKVINFLKEEKLLSDSMLVEAREASEEDLLVVHTRRYLNELKMSPPPESLSHPHPVHHHAHHTAMVLCCCHHHRNPPCHLSPQLPRAEEGAEAPSDPDRRNHNGGEAGCGTRLGHQRGFCLSVWRASPGPPSLILMPIRAMGMSETSWTTSACTSWMSTTATSTLGTALPSRPSGGRWSWSGARRMMSTWLRWRGTLRRPSRNTCPTWWYTMQALTSLRGTALGDFPSAQRAS
uniref:Histone deacetylase 11 n=1 Tax=Callithrix jacchus TaxID=9483 RepID=F7I141_CALJA